MRVIDEELGFDTSKLKRDTDRLNQYTDELEIGAKQLRSRLREAMVPTRVIIDEFVINIDESTKNYTLEEMAMRVVLRREKLAIERMLLKRYGRDILTKEEFRMETKYGEKKTNDVIKVYKLEEEMFSIELTADVIVNEDSRV